MRPEAREQWSERYQTLRHSGTKRPEDDLALLHDPVDYSATGGPEGEAAYGRTRSDDGHYPWSNSGGEYDRDEAYLHGRGGNLRRHAADYGYLDPQQARYRGKGPRGYRWSDRRLHEEICERLTQHPGIDATHIEVQVHEGAVLLSGDVRRRIERCLAEMVVARIPYVTHISNGIRASEPPSNRGKATPG